MRTTTVDSPATPDVTGRGYAQAVLVEGASRLLFVSGQIPVDREGRCPADFAEQCRLAWSNVVAQLEAAGMGLDNLVKVTTFLARREDAVANRDIRSAVLGDRRPALTVIVTGIFDEAWLIEIEAVAAA
ncbi:RidA family protein [Enterovirga rhinocerotis]|uniref:Enamine deaminase RidA (YjgF/YER057c/UK114 family) n=1 Tax=Enterovirga rhinocerotis TaxID=1339210 RepID=A0A4V6PZI2_9HYPH|nr:RidA family protein [Enterovirga rhinocerotis]TDR89059.1 enamine deaminase RidA (YjgF/YER057c/UK114 family) [Enterovirga rhinocerotis]